MTDIKVLDCTLRDGGYVNNNTFGYKNIGRIIDALNESGIEIIECGYFKDTKDSYSKDITEYTSFKDFKEKHNRHLKDKEYTLMLLGEEYKIENLPKANNNQEVIRMSFHKKSVDKALRYAKIIQDKGYKLFLQPTVTVGYEDDELIDLLKRVNELNPYCVAIVDTFGQMREKDVKRLTMLFNKYLNNNIVSKDITKTTAFTDLLAFLKTINLDSLKEGINSVQRVLGVFQDLSGSKNENEDKKEYKPRPLYKHFED